MLIFWAVTLMLFLYVYAGYPCLLVLLKGLKRPQRGVCALGRYGSMRSVTVIVAAHNEGGNIRKRIDNIFACAYPQELLEVVVVSDGSTDSTVRNANSFDSERVKVMEVEPQRGRANAHNLGVERASGEIVIFTDAETSFDQGFISEVVKNYNDPRVGAVCGELRWIDKSHTSVTASMGLYWGYEIWLRRMESAIGIMAVGSGACLSVKRDLYRPIRFSEDVDCVVPLDVVRQGYTVIDEPEAVAFDFVTSSIIGEFRARTRMVALDVVGILRRTELLNPFRYGWISAGIFSHKLLRWMGSFLILSILASTTVLAFESPFFYALWWLQAGLLLAGIFGLMMEIKGKRVFLISQIFSFILANAGFFAGVVLALSGFRYTKYDKVEVGK